MNTKLEVLIIIFAIIILQSCQPSGESLNEINVVDIESNINDMENVFLSQLANDIIYIPLESCESIPQISKLLVSGDIIAVTDAKQCLLFNTKGNYLRRIGKQGRGPGEYIYILNMGFGTQQNIYLSFMYDLLEYNIDGTFIKQYNNIFKIDDMNFTRTWFPINDSLFLGRIPNSTGTTEYKAAIVNKKSHSIKLYSNYDLFPRQSELSSGYEGFSEVYTFQGNTYYKELYNDTIFRLDKSLEMVPTYVFKLGKYKEPVSERIKIPPGDFWRYIYVWDVFQINKYLLIRLQFGHHFPAKRLTSYIPSYVAGLKPSWYNTTDILGIYDIELQKLLLIKPTDTDNPLFTTGFFNDIDAGPRFFPKVQMNDSTLVMWIEAKEFKDHIASDDFKKSKPKYPDKKKQLEEMASGISEFDNPILMFVTFNK